jgi:hypothetical protein
MPEIKKTDDEVKREFLEYGSRFFTWNSGKNTPNILLKLANNTSELNETLKEASASSDRLATSLNRLTTVALCLTAIGLLIAGGNLIVNIIEIANP